MRFHFSCTRDPHTEREVYTMRTPRLRLLSAILAVAMFFTLLPVSALAEGSTHTGTNHVDRRTLDTDNKDNQGLTYTLNADNTATVASYNDGTPDGVIDIPDTVTSGGQPYTVTAIGEYAFNPSRTITNVSSVFIPATVTSIGRFAFRCCKFLATVTFAEGSQLKSIGVSAFSGTTSAHPRFTEIQIPDSVETISTNAFHNCQDLESITLPASLKTIESSAFSSCRKLSEIRLPTSLKAIQSYVFDDCSSLETVFYDGSLAQWSQINTSNGFLGYSCPSLVMGDYTAQFISVKDENDPDPPPKTVTITKYTGTESTVILPSTINSWPVTKIGEDAFQDNTTITSVTIPASVTEIGANAFAGCTNLTSVHYEGDWSNLTIQSGNPAVQDAANEQLFDFEFTPDNTAVIVNNYKCKGTAADVTIPSRYQGKPVTMIDHAAFHNSAVTSVTIPDSVTSIHDSAFAYCSSLTNISIPNSVTYIGSFAFEGCTKLESITLPSSLLTISEFLFYDCSQLTTIHIPDSVSSIRQYAFYNCGKLKTIRIPVSVTSIGSYAFDDCPSSMTVTYSGSKKQWDAITKGSYNGVLENDLVCAKLEATFTADGTTFAQPQTIDRGKKFTEPAAPSKENHTFAGWYNGDEPFDFDADTTNAPNVLELVAKWEKSKYTVQFVSDYGSFADQTVEHGKPIETDKLTIPTVEGYTFDGWYADDTRTKEFDFSTPITSNTTVYAKWEKNAPVLPDTYALNVSGAFVYVDGVDVTAPAGDTSLPLEKDASVRLVADPDRMPSGMVFDRWTILNGALNADDAEKFETGRTLEEFAFTMPAEPLSIEATPRMQEEEGSDTVSVIAGVTLGTAATALVAWQAYDLGMSLYQEHWLPADFVMPKTRAELALLLWNTAGRPAPAAQPAFADITDPDTAQAAQWAVETGLMTPKSADRFKPEKSVTRWKAVRSWKRVTNQNT